ncbi:hypothetical protein KM043_014164 [Ampulex compressa]|nr:hypothetical protein KM043_014164 [Ampulex compressa]
MENPAESNLDGKTRRFKVEHPVPETSIYRALRKACCIVLGVENCGCVSLHSREVKEPQPPEVQPKQRNSTALNCLQGVYLARPRSAHAAGIETRQELERLSVR